MNRNEPKAAFFVGGPLDGRKQMIEGGQTSFRVPYVRGEAQLNEPEPIRCAAVVYMERQIFGVRIWCPEQMRIEQVVELLVQRYFK